MATGALDANGIWQYGEDDSEATFSVLLNKLASSTSDTVTRLEDLSGLSASQYATHRANLRVGTFNMVPSSVTYVSGSGSETALGLIEFSACTKVQIADIFSTSFKNYFVNFKASTSVTGAVLSFRLMTGTSTEATTNYAYNGTVQAGTAAPAAYQNAAATAMALGLSAGQTGGSYTILEPNEATLTRYIGATSGYSTADAHYTIGGYHSTTSAYTGLSFYPSSGTMTGEIQIFGFND